MDQRDQQQKKLEDLGRALHVLGHPTKLRVLEYVLQQQDEVDKAVVPALTALRLEISEASAAYSLKRMHEAGILKRQVSGRFTFYSIDATFFEMLKEFFL